MTKKYKVTRKQDNFTTAVEDLERKARGAAHIGSTVETVRMSDPSRDEAALANAVVTALHDPEHLSSQEKMRIAYALRMQQQLTYREIAETLGYASPVGAFNAVARVEKQALAKRLDDM